MKQTEDEDALLDFIYQANFTITKKGYSPKEVDLFIEELKDECRMWNAKYREVAAQLKLQQEEET